MGDRVPFDSSSFKSITNQHSLKHLTAANREFPPCTQGQHPINRETGYSNVLGWPWISSCCLKVFLNQRRRREMRKWEWVSLDGAKMSPRVHEWPWYGWMTPRPDEPHSITLSPHLSASSTVIKFNDDYLWDNIAKPQRGAEEKLTSLG